MATPIQRLRLPPEDLLERVTRLREYYRAQAYRTELHTGHAPVSISDGTDELAGISRIAGVSRAEAQSVQAELDAADDPLVALSQIVKGVDEATLNYLYADCSYKYFIRKYLNQHFSRAFAPLFHDSMFETARMVETHAISTPCVSVGPRAWGKSLILGITMPIKCIIFPHYIYYPDRELDISKRSILFISLDLRSSVRSLTSVCNEFETNEIIRRDFGEFYHDPEAKLRRKPWSKTLAVMLNGKRMEAASRNTKIRGIAAAGTRPDLILPDDVEPDEEGEALRRCERDYRWMTRVVINAVHVENGNVVILGNDTHDNGVISRMIEHGRKQGWRVNVFKVFEIDPQSGEKIYTWPEVFGPEFEREKLAVIGDAAFASEYQMEGSGVQKQLSKEDFTDYTMADLRPILQRLTIYGAIDPAPTTNPRSDDTAIGGIGEDTQTGLIYVLPATIGQFPIITHQQKVLDFCFEWNPKTFGVETTNYQLALKSGLDERAEQEGLKLPLTALNQSGDKKSRIANRLFGRILRGVIRFCVGDPGNEKIKVQLMKLINTDSHDDGADMLEMAVRLRDMDRLGKKKTVGYARALVVKTDGRRKGNGRNVERIQHIGGGRVRMLYRSARGGTR